MEQRPFGPAKTPVPVIGQGTWHMEDDRRAAAIAALRLGLDLGLTHVDTAELYGSGAVEELTGEAIAGRRDAVFLVSKVMPQNASRDGTIAACERSLKRLGTDRLDCYLLHWRGRHPLADTIAALERLKDAGKIASWGVSNFDVDDMEEALALAGPGRIACNQVLYNLGERGIEHALVPWCEKHGVTVVAYSPLKGGLTGKGRATLDAIAARHGATAEQVALAFLTRRSSVVTIPKSSTPDHVRANARAVTLDADDIARIDKAFPLGRPSSLAML